MHFKQIESTTGITFYPEVRYRRIRVYPQWWHPSSAEPLVYCWMQATGQGVDSFGLRAERAREAWRQGDYALSEKIWDEISTESRAIRAALAAEGWKDKSVDGLEGYVHVDNLEKIEGPPPVGEF